MRFRYEMESEKYGIYVDLNKAYLICDDSDDEFAVVLTKILQQIWNENGSFDDADNEEFYD